MSPEAPKQPSVPNAHSNAALRGVSRLLRFRRTRNMSPDATGIPERAATLSAPVVGNEVEASDLIGHELSGDAKKFWEQGSFKPAKSFIEQLDELESSPESRQNVIHAQPATLFSQGLYGNLAKRTKYSFTEAEGMKDLRSFLGLVNEVASKDTSEEGAKNVRHAQNFMEQFSFLGQPEYQEACRGLAQLWAEYVSQGPDYVLNLYLNDQKNRSANQVLRDVVGAFGEIAGDSPLAARIITDPEQWQSGGNSKLVVLDDWVTSGATIRESAAHAIIAAAEHGKPELADRLEGHVLVAVNGQAGKTYEARGKHFTLHGYFKTGSEQPVSGAHSSVDYNFETPLKWFQDYLHGQGIDHELPMLAYIDRSYRPTELAAGSEKLLDRYGQLNAQDTALLNEQHGLENEIQAMMAKIGAMNESRFHEISDRLDALRNERQSVLHEQDALETAYRQLNGR